LRKFCNSCTLDKKEKENEGKEILLTTAPAALRSRGCIVVATASDADIRVAVFFFLSFFPFSFFLFFLLPFFLSRCDAPGGRNGLMER